MPEKKNFQCINDMEFEVEKIVRKMLNYFPQERVRKIWGRTNEVLLTVLGFICLFEERNAFNQGQEFSSSLIPKQIDYDCHNRIFSASPITFMMYII